MINLMNLLVISSLTLSFNLFGATLNLSEPMLIEMSKKGSPQLDQIQAAFLGAELASSQGLEKYAPELFGQGVYKKTNEKSMTTFQPVFSPIKTAQLGVRKSFVQGFDTSAYLETDQRSAQLQGGGRLQNVTATTLVFKAQMDIWKNLFGNISKRELESFDLDKKRAEIEKDIQTKAFNIALRRVYWSLVANKESFMVLDSLLKTAAQQSKESKERQRNSIAEADEVARYEAQLASRQAAQHYLEFQREILIKQLRNLLPELSASEIVLDKYDLNKAINEVLVCTTSIGQQSVVPYEFTQYDEVIAMLRKVKSNNTFVNNKYSDADMKLFGSLQSKGVGSNVNNNQVTTGSYGTAFSDQLDNNRAGYEIGVSVTLPFGSAKESSLEVKKLYDEKRLDALINSTDAQIVSTHQQLSKSVTILVDVIRAQKANTAQLSKQLTIMKKKYRQARITVDQLVQDQDSLLNSELSTIDTQLQILNTLFDYLVIYTEIPCSFNRI